MFRSLRSCAGVLALTATMVGLPLVGLADPAGATGTACTGINVFATVTNTFTTTQQFNFTFTLPAPPFGPQAVAFNAGDRLTIDAPATDASITLLANGAPTVVTGPAAGPVSYVVPSDYLVPVGGSAGVRFDFKLAGGATTTISCAHVTAVDQLNDLAAKVVGVGPGKSLANKVAQASASLAANDIPNTCLTLQGFIDEVKAQSGKKITAAVAASLTNDAQSIRTALAC